jgi:hypothetical protein
MCYAGRQCGRRHREGVIIARLKLHLHPHVAGECCPDERVSLRDATMGGKLCRHVSLLVKDPCHPFTNGVLGAGEPAPRLGKWVGATGHSAGDRPRLS